MRQASAAKGGDFIFPQSLLSTSLNTMAAFTSSHVSPSHAYSCMHDVSDKDVFAKDFLSNINLLREPLSDSDFNQLAHPFFSLATSIGSHIVPQVGNESAWDSSAPIAPFNSMPASPQVCSDCLDTLPCFCDVFRSFSCTPCAPTYSTLTPPSPSHREWSLHVLQPNLTRHF